MFKPKASKEKQPFYLSWFANQGENLKRGGTAPQESRKERLQLKSPYQQPMATVIHVAPNPYTKTIQAPKPYTTMSQISKIYAGQPKSQLLKRRSQEYEKQRYDVKESFQPSRTFTQQGVRPQRFQDVRPQTQQLQIETKLAFENLVSDDDEQERLTPREGTDIIEIANNEVGNDCFSNESNEADSEEHQSFQLPTQENQERHEMQKNKSFAKEEPIANLRKLNVQYNRPQTSEGGRRKRFMNSLSSQEQNYEKKKDTEHNILESEAFIIQEDESENYDVVEKQPMTSPKEIASIRSGYRKKQQNDINNELMIIDTAERPPSRHKTPPKATGLELPLQNGESSIQRNSVEIPIKNMYASMNDENNDDGGDFDLDFFKMNNKMNFQKFQQKEVIGYHTDDGSKEQVLKHPKSANVKQNQLYSPLNSQITSAHLRNEPQIVIKYNNSSGIQKSDQPVKVPFQTSLGQDFLRLFANDCID